MKRGNLISMALAAITLVGPVVQSGPKAPGRPGRGRYAFDGLLVSFAWGECRADDWQCSPSGEHLAYNSNDHAKEDSTSPIGGDSTRLIEGDSTQTPVVATSPTPSNSNTTRLTKRSVEGSDQEDINAILGKILDRIVKAQEDSRQKDIDHIWTKLLERLIKAQEDAAKPSNPWNTNSIPTFALSAATFVIGILTFINSKEWLVKIPIARRFFLLFWKDTPGLEEKVKALESMVGQAAQQAIPAAQQSNQPQPAPQPTLMERVNTLSTDVRTLQTDASQLTPRVDSAITRLNQIFDATGPSPAGMVVDLTKAITALGNRLNKVYDTTGATPAGLVVDLSTAVTKLIFDDTGAAPAGALATAQSDIAILRGLLDQISVVNGGQMTGRLPDVERNITEIKRDLKVLGDNLDNHESKTAAVAHIASS